MARFNGFVGGSYPAQSLSAACDRSINLSPELVQSGTGAGPMSFYGCPGITRFLTLPHGPVRGLWGGNARLVAVGGNHVYEIMSDATANDRGSMGLTSISDRKIVSIVQGGSQIAIANNNRDLWVYTGTPFVSGTLTRALRFADDVTYLNGYFLALSGLGGLAGNAIRASKIFDATSWDPLQTATRSTSSDPVQRIINFNDQLWLLGKRTISVWTIIDPGTSGAFPFQDYPPGAMDLGIWAEASLAKLDSSLFFLAGDERGVPIVVRVNGYTAQRVSDFAVEQAMMRYNTDGSGFKLQDYSDAVGYGYNEAGHSFYVLIFPGADKAWVYDVTMNKWHERARWDGSSFDPDTSLTRPPGQCHAWASAAFTGVGDPQTGAHFLGDGTNGNIYISSVDTFDDDGSPMLFQRTAPHLNLEYLWERHVSLEVLMEQGLITGPTPQMWLEISDDGGRTFGSPLAITLGAAGDYNHKAWWRRLGRSRNRVYRLTRTDANRQVWIDAFIRVQQGNGS